MALARFLYGVAVGLVFGWVALVWLETLDTRWLLVAAALSLGLALLLHQRATREKRGRRWRRTTDL
jgi:hypothetical protein